MSQLTGISFNISTNYFDEKVSKDYHFDFRSEKPENPYGFLFRILFFWKRFEISFVPDNYALQLIQEMEKNKASRSIFSVLAQTFDSPSEKLFMKINGQETNPLQPSSWKKDWRKIDISIVKYTEELDLSNISLLKPYLTEFASRFFTMVISLMPTEETRHEEPIKAFPEGAKRKVEQTKYERDPRNRAACIAIHGTSCAVCEIKFEEKYGRMGIGFIHVHHQTPISEIGEGFLINPSKDLIPVCPNCHAMLHKENPPMSVKELKRIYKINE